MELHFSPGPEGRHPVPAPTPAVPFVLVDDPVVRADSPLIIEQYDVDEDYDEGRSIIYFLLAKVTVDSDLCLLRHKLLITNFSFVVVLFKKNPKLYSSI